jgi:acid phosphatase type 7
LHSEWFDDNAYAFTAYLARFDNPTVNGKRELYYSFDAGLVHWVMVAGYCPEMKSTSTQPCLQEGSAQRAWLEDDLTKVDRSVTPWVVVFFHEPYVNSNTAHPMSSEGAPMQAAIEGIMYDYKVDIVLSGHVHAYERSCSLYQYKCMDGAPYYITIGDGGNKEGLASGWISPQPEWSLFRQASYGFGKLQVKNSTHALWSWHQNSDLIPTIADEYYFVKGGDSSSNLHAAHRVHTTREPVFANGARGERARAFDRAALLESARENRGH